jgi:molecular chaperone DnaJ
MSSSPEHKDYYQILGVLQTANESEIAAAYRLLAYQHHPDAGGTDPESLAKLKQVNEAYEVLSDAVKRREYDRQHGPAASETVLPRDGSWSVPVQPLRTVVRPPTASIPTGAGDVQLELPIAPEEARQGGPCDFTITLRCPCVHCAGSGRIAGRRCGTCRGGGSIMQQRQVRIVLPRQVRTGTVVRIPASNIGMAHAHGDLILRLRIQPTW